MKRYLRALAAAAAALLAALAMAACGGGDGGKPEKDQSQVDLGEAGRGTNARPDEVAPGATERPDGALEGEPSLDDLDRSAPPPGAFGAPGTRCAGGGLEPDSANLSQVGRTTVCLLNVERKVRGIGRLRTNARLARAALAHAKDMVARTYFAHDSLSGASFIDRIKRTGYMGGGGRWTVGENLAWGGGSRSTPREIVDAWMQSPPHRANILSRRFREIGIGVALGSPRGRVKPAATYNTDFGTNSSG